MLLKRLTSGFVLLLLVALVGWPWWLGARPEAGAARQVFIDYAVRSLIYIGVVLVGIVGAGICSFLLIRSERERYRKEALENLEQLIIGVTEDKLAAEDSEESQKGPQNG